MNVGDVVDDFELDLVTGFKFNLYSALKNGPVILNFIMGTWCPFCTNHLSKIRLWQSKLDKNTTMLIISSEEIETLRDYIKKNPTSYLFATDPNLDVIKMFQTKNMVLPTATPATFLIDQERRLRMLFKGVRTKDSREKLISDICNTCG